MDPVGDLTSFAFKSRPLYPRIVPIAHNAKTFLILFPPNRLVQIKYISRAVPSRRVSKRAMNRTWVVCPVRIEVLSGFSLLKIHKFYEYEVPQYNPKLL
jgi:hypothetical protein